MVHRDLRGNLKRGKIDLHYIDNGYTTQRGLQHSSEWISHAGLFVSVVTQTAMARLTLPPHSHSYGTTHTYLSLTLESVHTHTHSSHLLLLLFTCSHLKVCPSCIYTQTIFWLFTYLTLMGRTFRLFTSIISRVGYINDSGFSLGLSASAESLINSTPVFRLFDGWLSEQSNLSPTGGTYSQQMKSLLRNNILQSRTVSLHSWLKVHRKLSKLCAWVIVRNDKFLSKYKLLQYNVYMINIIQIKKKMLLSIKQVYYKYKVQISYLIA